jgi:flagellar motor protein MotB
MDLHKSLAAVVGPLLLALTACSDTPESPDAGAPPGTPIETLDEPAPAPPPPPVAARPFTSPAPRIHNSAVQVVDTPHETIVRVPADLFFRSGQHVLSDEGRRVLDQIAELIKRSHPTGAIRVEGHADSDPIKKSGNHCNFELAYKRAHTVMHALAEKGVPPARLSIASMGEHKPQDPMNKARNRRVEIVIVKQ